MKTIDVLFIENYITQGLAEDLVKTLRGYIKEGETSLPAFDLNLVPIDPNKPPDLPIEPYLVICLTNSDYQENDALEGLEAIKVLINDRAVVYLGTESRTELKIPKNLREMLVENGNKVMFYQFKDSRYKVATFDTDGRPDYIDISIFLNELLSPETGRANPELE